MRKKQQKQMPLIEPACAHPQERELEIISQIIDHTPTICEYVLQDLNEGKAKKRNTGAEGMDACGSSCIKPEGATSGFSIFMPIKIADHPLGHKPNRRSEPNRNIYQQTGQIKGMIWIFESFGN